MCHVSKYDFDCVQTLTLTSQTDCFSSIKRRFIAVYSTRNQQQDNSANRNSTSSRTEQREKREEKRKEKQKLCDNNRLFMTPHLVRALDN